MGGKNLGRICLSRTDTEKDYYSLNEQKSRRKNLKEEITVTKTQFICQGNGEKYPLSRVCKFDQSSESRTCTLRNGEVFQLNPR